ncbi:NAD-P-binding protein [Dendrothele bispora CBS 962.96]|uniref:NAD-P-binding protein n=1 Tax=Dendrothele bispora (strain CBS 962.96) TaxID=1314807 RepID=A0A4S8MSX6_DENBC|nr:NAD-P-binding protein [Dendrothele bispora CBS 962.96]
MRLLILGATGPVGILLTREVLSSLTDCSVVLYVRSPEKLPEDVTSNTAVTVINGQLTNLELLSQAMEGVDAVLSALGPSVKKGPFHPSGQPLAHAMENVIQLMHKNNVKRLMVLGTASITAPEDKFDIKFQALVTGVAVGAHNAYKDVVAIGENVKKENDLDWTIVRVPILTNKETRDIVPGFIGDHKVGTTLARVGFGVFVAEQLKDENSPWIRKAPMICTP